MTKLSTVIYVRVSKFVELTGYTDKAVRCKIAEGVWLEGKHYRRAPDGAILMNLEAYERWVEGESVAASRSASIPSASDSHTKASAAANASN
ncbi:MAG TPA: excisionase [Rhizomicrobium sp.]|nr:excisionase [Rhizomicrobium sp.]